MSGSGSPPTTKRNAHGRQVCIVATRWHGELVDALLAGALDAVTESGATAYVERVPGAFELPVVADALARSDRYDALVCLGVVMRGGTPHFDYVCRAVADGCLRVSLDHRIPVGFGVLTVDDETQAKARLGKGREAVDAVLETVQTLDDIRRRR
jgi:6,7-dimethyl-8-ribityllumazine synthase